MSECGSEVSVYRGPEVAVARAHRYDRPLSGDGLSEIYSSWQVIVTVPDNE